MLIEGRNAVTEALESGMTVKKIILQKGINDGFVSGITALAKSKNVPFEFADREKFFAACKGVKSQGVMAEIKEYGYCDVDDILEYAKSKGEDPFIVILDGLEDPHNLGSVIRVCECAGAHGVIIPKNRSVEVTDTVFKISAGAINYVKVARVTNINDTVKYLKQKGVWVYAAEAGGQNLYKTDLKGPLALVIGGEDTGVSRLTKELSDLTISIPMFGKINSLNASVACGIVLYEAVRQRKGE